MWHKSRDTSTEPATGPVDQTFKLSPFQLAFQQMFEDLQPNAWATLVFNRIPSTCGHSGANADTQVQQRSAGAAITEIRYFPEFRSGSGRGLAPVSIDSATATLCEFHQRLDARVFGRAWYRNTGRRSPFIGVIEHADTNLHLHVAFRFPADRLDVAFSKANALWRKLVPSGNAMITAIYDVGGLASYNAKRLTPATSELILLSTVGSLTNL